MLRLALIAAFALLLLGGAAPAPASADGFTIVLTPLVAGATTVSGAVRNVPPGTVTVKLELRLKAGDTVTQTIDQVSNGNFLFKDVKAGAWSSLKATAQGGVAEQSVEVGPEWATPSNGYGDGAYQGYNGPYYFPQYLGVNGSGYSYPGNYGGSTYGPYAYPGSYFYPGSYAYPGLYSQPGTYFYPGFYGPGGTSFGYPYTYPYGYGYNGAPPAYGYPGPYAPFGPGGYNFGGYPGGYGPYGYGGYSGGY